MDRIVKRDRNRQLERITEWGILLDIAIAPHTKDGRGAKELHRHLQEMRRAIERGPEAAPVIDLDFHRSLIDLNKRRRARKEAG